MIDEVWPRCGVCKRYMLFRAEAGAGAFHCEIRHRGVS